ncbi:MAG TPA: CapA family protein [Acidimicrobiia bacterium]|nr:CapA family protein [Acidimicrobiia bacterium]
MRRSTLLVAVLVGGSLLGAAAFVVAPPAGSVEAALTTTTTSPPAPATTLPPPVTTTAATTTTTGPPRQWLTIHGVGDTNFDTAYIPNLARHGYEYAFGGLDGLFLDDSLTVINLECSPSRLGSPLPKEFTFRCDPDSLAVAREHGVDVANLANNHGQDYGIEAMLDGWQNVLRSGIRPVGVGPNLAAATAPAVYQMGGWRVAVVGMGGVVPSPSWLATEDRPGMASGDDIDQMVASVERAARVADIVVVTIHWMWELETVPRADDRERAEAMVAAGADVIFGHHPHRLGELEYIDGRPVFWTLGNFVWPRLSDAGATTAVARVVISPDGEIDACLIPAFIETSGQPVLQAPPPCRAGG